MNKITYVSACLLLLSKSVYAEKMTSKQEAAPSTLSSKLPVLIDRGIVVLEGDDSRNFIEKLPELKNFYNYPVKGNVSKIQSRIQEKIDVDYKTIKNLVQEAKTALCSVNQEGAYEIWIEAGISGGVFVASASAQSGIKAIINCSAQDR